MRRWTRERAPTAKRSRRGRAQEQKLPIGPVKRLRFTRTRQRARQANEALGRLLERIKRLRFTRTRQRARHANEALGRLLERIKRAVTNIRPPLPDTEASDSPTKSLRASVLSATLCLGVAALLVSGKIVEIADRMPLGPDRDRWLEVATETDRMANRLALNRPYDLLRDLQGAGDDAGQQIDVIGDVEDLLQLELDGVSEQPPAPTTTVTPPESAAVATTTVPTTETPATDPSATDPSATDTPATDPSATDPSATDPSAHRHVSRGHHDNDHRAHNRASRTAGLPPPRSGVGRGAPAHLRGRRQPGLLPGPQAAGQPAQRRAGDNAQPAALHRPGPALLLQLAPSTSSPSRPSSIPRWWWRPWEATTGNP